ncbi:hypothetical protein CBS63078_1089 [Aspergillus niger]|nr:hypothetical protein CBS115989_311 [Aspergillus niger]KAI2833823.1 hypothetical protein CBS133816_164 [Aspergillus niger]KAI2862671.1 hypothetical protein CBS11232_154 [Aspergillus niger]KAI2878277.1 hypothetical protein CBS115988_3348 [Aspergillus niger]KAI2905891.1 hypothetical protein CBS13152_75 [Aspergillus niger]
MAAQAVSLQFPVCTSPLSSLANHRLPFPIQSPHHNFSPLPGFPGRPSIAAPPAIHCFCALVATSERIVVTVTLRSA